MHRKNLKMGKDIRGIERGKCASVWWVRNSWGQTWSDGVTCGYCGCLPTRHSKKDAHYSSDSVGATSGAGTSESVSPEKWKDEDLRWFPSPKGEFTKVSNSILPKFYLSHSGPLFPTRNAFAADSWLKVSASLVGSSRHFESNKSQVGFCDFWKSSGCREIHGGNLSAAHHDATTIQNNIDDLSKLKVKIDELNAKVRWQSAVRFNRHRKRILQQNPTRKHYRRQNMDESGHGSREAILLVWRT